MGMIDLQKQLLSLQQENLGLKTRVQNLQFQEELLSLRQENFAMKARLQDLESRMYRIEEERKSEAAAKECAASPSPELLSKLEEIVDTKVSKRKEKVESTVESVLEEKVILKIKAQVDEELKEQKRRSALALNILIGGLPADWYRVEDSYSTLIAKLKSHTPMIEWNDDVIQEIGRVGRVTYAYVVFKTKKDRINILQQSKKLKGTSLWISEELTRKQLKERSAKLVQVNAARQAGKWAVYRDGRAVIKEFRSPKT